MAFWVQVLFNLVFAFIGIAAAMKGAFNIAVALWIATSLCAGAVVWCYGDEYPWYKPNRKSSIATVIIVLILGIPIYYWLKPQDIIKDSSSSKTNVGIFFECIQALPIKASVDGRIWAVSLYDPNIVESGRGGLEVISGREPGQEEKRDADIVLCRVENLGNAAIFNVSMKLRISFMELSEDDVSDKGISSEPKQKIAILERSKDGTSIERHLHSGKEKSGPYPIEISRIDPGSSNAFNFYIYNTTQQYSFFIYPPKTAKFRLAVEGTQQTVDVLAPPDLVKSGMNILSRPELKMPSPTSHKELPGKK